MACTIAIYRQYRSVVIAKLTYASSAWWGFTSATDRQRLDAFIRRSERSYLVPPNLPSFAELCRTTDDRLFNLILSNKAHVLNNLLPPTSVASQNYNLRQRRHHLELPNKTNHLIGNNFIQRMLFHSANALFRLILTLVNSTALMFASICFLKILICTFFFFFIFTSFTITTYCFAAFGQHEIKYVMMMMIMNTWPQNRRQPSVVGMGKG